MQEYKIMDVDSTKTLSCTPQKYQCPVRQRKAEELTQINEEQRLKRHNNNMNPGSERKNAMNFTKWQQETLEYGRRIRQQYCIHVKFPDFIMALWLYK